MTLKILAKPSLLLAMILMAAFGLSACNNDAAADKVAMVDAEAVFQKSKLAAAGMQHIESLNAQLQERLGKMQEELLADPDNNELEQRLQGELFALQGSMDEGQRAVAEQINKLFDQAVEDCRKAGNLEVVLPKQLVMAAREGADITDKVVELMDKQTVDFSAISLKLPEPAKPAASTPESGEGQDAAPSGEGAAEGAAADKPAETPAAQ